MTLTHGIPSGGEDDENRYLTTTSAEDVHSASGEVADNNIAASSTRLAFHRRCGELITLSSNTNSSSNSFSTDSGRR